jgi:hypothetical protein
MPKIRPAPKEDRQAFGKQLSKGQRRLFNQLAHLVDQHRTTLDWYHAVGKLVRELHEAIAAARRGTGWAATSMSGATSFASSGPLSDHGEVLAFSY